MRTKHIGWTNNYRWRILSSKLTLLTLDKSHMFLTDTSLITLGIFPKRISQKFYCLQQFSGVLYRILFQNLKQLHELLLFTSHFFGATISTKSILSTCSPYT